MQATNFAPIIRPATLADAAAINKIYNHYIKTSSITFDVDAWNLPRREQWIAQFNTAANPYFVLVAECDGAVAGFAFNSQFRGKKSYRFSTETTVYVAADFCGGGFGAALYKELFARITAAELHRAIAVIALPNPRSIAFHLTFGFTQIGILTEVGHKFGRYIDTAYLEKKL